MGPIPTPAADDPAAPPDLFTATVAQLGLKLESAKVPVDVMVILKTAVSQQRWRSEEHFQGLFLAERHERRH